MANRQTKIIGGNGTQAQAFTLDPGLFQYVQSVLVEVDNTAGPDVRPTLSVQTVNGAPIADKRQGEVIPAGDTGRATWALRLTDEGAATPGGGGGLTLIDDVLLAVDTATVTVAIPNTFRHLQFELSTRSTFGGAGALDLVQFQLNGDGGAHYWTQGFAVNTVTSFYVSYNAAAAAIPGETSNDAAIANAYGACTVKLLDYNSTTRFKQWTSEFSEIKTVMLNHTIGSAGGAWNQLAAVTSVTFSANQGNLKAGSRITVYGL